MLDSRPRAKMAASALRTLLGARLVCGMMRPSCKSRTSGRLWLLLLGIPGRHDAWLSCKKCEPSSLEMPRGELFWHAVYGTHSCVHTAAASQSDASLRFLPLAEF